MRNGGPAGLMESRVFSRPTMSVAYQMVLLVSLQRERRRDRFGLSTPLLRQLRLRRHLEKGRFTFADGFVRHLEVQKNLHLRLRK